MSKKMLSSLLSAFLYKFKTKQFSFVSVKKETNFNGRKHFFTIKILFISLLFINRKKLIKNELRFFF